MKFIYIKRYKIQFIIYTSILIGLLTCKKYTSKNIDHLKEKNNISNSKEEVSLSHREASSDIDEDDIEDTNTEIIEFEYKPKSWFEGSPQLDFSLTNKENIKAAIIPHAGLKHCGDIIKSILEQINWSDHDSIILLSTKHQFHNKNDIDIYQLSEEIKEIRGPYDLNDHIINIKNHKKFNSLNDLKPFEEEHSWQVILPYIIQINKYRKSINKGPINFSPIIIGQYDSSIADQISTFLSKNNNVILIANTDLLHCGPNYHVKCPQDIEQFNKNTVQNIKNSVNSNSSLKRKRNNLSTMCGYYAIKTFIKILNSINLKSSIGFEYKTSDNHEAQNNNKISSVGYSGLTFYLPENDTQTKKKTPKPIDLPRKVLLDLVGIMSKNTLDLRSNNEKIELLSNKYNKEGNKISGLFVTIKKNNKYNEYKLRGCIGNFNINSTNIGYWIANLTLKAAFQDKRFDPMSSLEIKELKDQRDKYEFELNFLNKPFEIYTSSDSQPPYIKVKNKWKSGVHGILIYFDDGKHATFLSSVFKENFNITEMSKKNWNKVVKSLKEKAGSSSNISKIKLYKCTTIIEDY